MRGRSRRANKSYGLGLVLVCLCVGFVRPSEAQLAPSAWPMAGHDLLHTGRSPFVGPQSANVKWVFATPLSVKSSPAIGTDGTIYIGLAGQICAINPDGTEKWCNDELATIRRSSPAVGVDGMVYVGSRDNRLWAFDSDGVSQWSFPVGDDGDVSTSPAIGPDGTVYMAGTFSGSVHALNDDGSLKWKFVVGASILNSSPALAPTGMLYIGSTKGLLHALNPDGTRAWFVKFAGAMRNASPAIGANGTIFIGGLKIVAGVSPAGTVLWTYPIVGRSTSPAIAVDGTVYVGSSGIAGGRDSAFYALTPGGGLVWSYPSDDGFRAAPVIGADGTIYTTSGKKVLALRPNGTLLWEYETLKRGDILAAPAIAADGTLYVGSEDLYAFE